jgi:hypothetical protein
MERMRRRRLKLFSDLALQWHQLAAMLRSLQADSEQSKMSLSLFPNGSARHQSFHCRLRRAPVMDREMNGIADFDPELSVNVRGNDIVVTLQGTSYAVTYFKRRGSPGLFAKDIVSLHKNDARIPMTFAEFLASAWKVANDKARELGWIV